MIVKLKENFAKSFFMGILAAFASLVLEIIISDIFSFDVKSSFFSGDNISASLLLFILIEESIKYVMVFRIWRTLGKRSPDETEAGSNSDLFFVNSILVGLGFAATEVFAISLGGWNFEIRYLEGIAGVLLAHVSTAALMGILINRQKFFFQVSALSLAFLVHFAYNFSIIREYNYLYAIAGLTFLLLLTVFVKLFFLRNNTG